MVREGKIGNKNDCQVSDLWTEEMLASFSETENLRRWGRC